jgi:hypothetical protein
MLIGSESNRSSQRGAGVFVDAWKGREAANKAVLE